MREVAILIKDDLDHSQIAEEEVQLALDGTMVRLDLTRSRATALREFLEPYLTAGTPILKMDAEPDRQRGGTPQRKAYLNALRIYAADHGYDLADRPPSQYPVRVSRAFDAALVSGEIGPDGKAVAK